MSNGPRATYVTASRVCCVVALILFVLAALSVTLGTINLIAAGLAFLAAGMLL